MRFRPLTRPLKAPRRARALAALAFMALLFVLALVSFGLVSIAGALTALVTASALALLALVMAVYALGRIWYETGKGALDALLGIVWALPVLVAAGALTFVLTQTDSYPDLATNVNNPPRFVALGQRDAGDAPLFLDRATPPERMRLSLAHPTLETLYIERPGWHVAQVLNALAANNDWPRVRAEQTGDQTFEAEFEIPGPVPLVPHDAAIRIVDDGQGSLVDIRMLANTPLHDFGTNARALSAFIDQFLLAIEATPPPVSDL